MYAENTPVAKPVEPDEILLPDDPRYALLSLQFAVQDLAETMEQVTRGTGTTIRHLDESRRRYSLPIFIATTVLGASVSMNAAAEALQHKPVPSSILSAASIAIWYMGYKTFRVARRSTEMN